MIGSNKFGWLKHPGYNINDDDPAPVQTTATNNTAPWSGAQGYITDYLSRAKQQSAQPWQQYQGRRIADITPEHQLGLAMTTNRALNGSPDVNAARQNFQKTMNGDFMSPESNPWLKQNVDTALGDVQTRVNSQFNKPGAFGGTANQEVLTRALGNTAADMYGQNYNNERQRQVQSQLFGTQLGQQDYTDAQALMGVGDINRGLQQDVINQQYGDWKEFRGWPQQQLDSYRQAVATGMGAGSSGTSTQQQPGYKANPLAGAIGGGTAGYALGNAFGEGYGGWGAALGALGGGLLA